MGRMWWARSSVLVILGIMLCPPATAGPTTCFTQMGAGPWLLPPPSCLPPDAPPRDLTATFDTATQTLTLSWAAPDATTGPDSYQVYRDGNLLTTTSSTTTTDDLSSFYGSHSYWISAKWGTHEGDTSLPIYIAKGGGIPSSCAIVDVSIYTSPNFVGAGIHDECIIP